MSDNSNFILIAAVGVAGYLIWKKKSQQTAAAAAQPQTNNVNNEMWTKLLGGAWTQLLKYNGQSSSGGTPFVIRDMMDGLFKTSDGKPLYTGDGATDYLIANTGLSGTAKDYMPASTGGEIGFMESLGFSPSELGV